MQFKTSDNVLLTYTSEGSGRSVLLLSGYSGIKEEWKYQKKILLANNYHVLTMDWRNHGESMRTSKNLRIYRLAADIAELIEHLELEKVILVGHSMGASAIWAYVSLFGEDKIEQIITVDQSPKLINDDYWKYGSKDIYWNNFWVNISLLGKKHLNAIALNPEFVEELKKQREQYPFDYELNQSLLVNHMEQDWRDIISTIKKPQLFIAGECSPLWPSKYAIFCADIAKDADVSVVKHAGHLVHMEVSEEFNQILLTFIMKKDDEE
ncbi:alpha/beta fold hydrolase [Liquorilactobacillus mali]|uniref:Halo peroxidase n=1 Tax=Liquorilactobacillus mali KCTC 3596 = DSM 20444 TaxID=1046596 RepID=J1F0Y9_9LACO|nr:alpha/beta hydrolase [Liquorilactobacillus mali]EJE97887.1 halo peroxidase [Liquorilactobacillus mali KCTC 3596 = DSM 20444]KRN09464.1 halo peroxidase [Liquorilactobacillus mali KCTC 3596 = DSM 20444]QFQ75664.1 alpha/beta hydrolase [Liquorilactobacillus mali]